MSFIASVEYGDVLEIIGQGVTLFLIPIPVILIVIILVSLWSKR